MNNNENYGTRKSTINKIYDSFESFIKDSNSLKDIINKLNKVEKLTKSFKNSISIENTKVQNNFVNSVKKTKSSSVIQR